MFYSSSMNINIIIIIIIILNDLAFSIIYYYFMWKMFNADGRSNFK